MGVVSIVLGVLLAVAGILCLFTPLITFVSVGYFIVILFFVYGIWAIINAIVTKRVGPSLVFGIISLIFGIVGLVYPAEFTLTTDLILLYLAGAWFILMGVFSIFIAFQQKKYEGKFGWFGMILGVLSIIVGALSFFQPQFMAVTMGILISIYFIESGVNLIALGTMFGSVKK